MRLFSAVSLVVICIASGCSMSQLFTQPEPLSTEEQVESLVRSINDFPDPLHNDYTPSVWKLIELGDAAMPRMVDLMLLDGGPYDEDTRLHAERVLFWIVCNKLESGPRWSKDVDRQRAKELWKSLGSLSHSAPLDDRVRAVKLWREWLSKQKGDGADPKSIQLK